MGATHRWSRNLASIARFPYVRLAGYPTLINLEVTHMCNARCDFCRYPATRAERRLDDYVPVVRALKPMVVMFTGGEAPLRRDRDAGLACLSVLL
jgi:MoaA/NifB/PqqE/SkfB family radical SAM enzyme